MNQNTGRDSEAPTNQALMSPEESALRQQLAQKVGRATLRVIFGTVLTGGGAELLVIGAQGDTFLHHLAVAIGSSLVVVGMAVNLTTMNGLRNAVAAPSQ